MPKGAQTAFIYPKSMLHSFIVLPAGTHAAARAKFVHTDPGYIPTYHRSLLMPEHDRIAFGVLPQGRDLYGVGWSPASTQSSFGRLGQADSP